MEPEKFERGIKKILQEREIKPSADSWNRLEQRLERKERPAKAYFWWVSTAAAVAVIFFIVGSYFNKPVPAETPQLVEETSEETILEEKTTEPEVLQVAASEGEENHEKSSAEAPAKNAIFEPPVPQASAEEIAVTSREPSEAAGGKVILENPVSETSKETSEAADAVAQQYPNLMEEIRTEIAAQDYSSEVSDHEIEALLLLAAAELEKEPVYSVNADDLLHQVEYELDQSFRQKVFEVVKDGLLKAKTAVANRDF